MNKESAAILNANTKAAIHYCETNPKEWESLLNAAVMKTLKQLEHSPNRWGGRGRSTPPPQRSTS